MRKSANERRKEYNAAKLPPPGEAFSLGDMLLVHTKASTFREEWRKATRSTAIWHREFRITEKHCEVKDTYLPPVVDIKTLDKDCTFQGNPCKGLTQVLGQISTIKDHPVKEFATPFNRPEFWDHLLTEVREGNIPDHSSTYLKRIFSLAKDLAPRIDQVSSAVRSCWKIAAGISQTIMGQTTKVPAQAKA